MDFFTDLRLENPRNNFTGPAVFNTIQQAANDHKTFRNNSAGLSGMHADIQSSNFNRAPEHASERGSHPKSVVIAAAAVQSDHQSDISELLFGFL